MNVWGCCPAKGMAKGMAKISGGHLSIGGLKALREHQRGPRPTVR